MRLFIMLLVLLPFIAISQGNKKFKGGVKAGLNLANTRYQNETESKKLGARTAFHGGVFGQYHFSKTIGVNADLVFSSEGYAQKETNYETILVLNYINLPILFRYMHSSGIFAQTGPQVGMLMSAKSTTTSGGTETETDVKKRHKSTNFSWGTGIGYIYKKFGIEARYNLGLTNVFNIGNEYKYTPSTVQVSLSFSVL
jgi:outer membrane immunogenic protein